MHAAHLNWWQTGLRFSCHPYLFSSTWQIPRSGCALPRYAWGYCTNYVHQKT